MKAIFLIVAIITLTINTTFSQDKIKGTYGGDLRTRAGLGLIADSQIEGYDFKKTGLQQIALIYWPDDQIGFQKIGITIFENKANNGTVTEDYKNFAESIVISKFENLNDYSFTKLSIEPIDLEQHFKIKNIGPGLKINESGLIFLAELKSKGFDGVFFLYESQLQDLFTASKAMLPSKGVYKFYKKELVYHGLYSLLINLNSMKVEKGIGYQQISGDYYEGDDIKELQDLTLVLEQVKVRFENNIDEIIRIHKLK
jgi:hypothetical protein